MRVRARARARLRRRAGARLRLRLRVGVMVRVSVTLRSTTTLAARSRMPMTIVPMSSDSSAALDHSCVNQASAADWLKRKAATGQLAGKWGRRERERATS